MAEARRAVEPMPSLNLNPVIDPKVHRAQVTMTRDGAALFVPHPRFWPRSALRVVKTAYTKMTLAFMPVPLGVVAAVEVGACLALFTSKSQSWIRESRVAHILWDINERLFFARYLDTEVKVAYLTFFPCLTLLGIFTMGHRMFLRLLLSYTGWVKQTRGKKALKTKIWGALLKYVYMRSAQHSTYAHQTSMPKQPLPDVEATVAQYLDGMKPLMSSEDHAELAAKGNAFIQGDGVKLQRYLKLKTWTSNNYVSDWWLDVVYLRSRGSLMINSNYYGLQELAPPPTTCQSARAANLVWHLLQVKLEIDREQLPVTMMAGMVPLCMSQYSGAFATTREPHVGTDVMTQYDSSVSRHIVVMCGGHFYKVKMFCDATGAPMEPLQLQATLRGIVDERARTAGATPAPEANIAALTALKRNKWAEVREEYFLRHAINRAALHAIESALFVCSLDDVDADHGDLTACGHVCMHGTGRNRWFDKSFNMIVTKNGYTGTNGEHAWADAPTLSHIMDLGLCREVHDVKAGIYGGPNGSIRPTPAQAASIAGGTFVEHSAERIVFHVNDGLAEEIDAAVIETETAIRNFDLYAKPFDAFGKGIMKKAGCSPDAFIQMALQLAYHRDQASFAQTYESCSVRLFREGRTETIRTVSSDSCAFVVAMSDGAKSKADRLALLQAACGKHTATSTSAAIGEGVDRHLFALYVVAVGTNVESPFLSAVFKRGWKLSTSQIPATPASADLDCPGTKHPKPAGGFGPVADDGYGVCYTIPSDDLLVFHVSAYQACAGTDAKRMWGRIDTALHDLADLVRK
jgi:hypothetical protein